MVLRGTPFEPPCDFFARIKSRSRMVSFTEFWFLRLHPVIPVGYVVGLADWPSMTSIIGSSLPEGIHAGHSGGSYRRLCLRDPAVIFSSQLITNTDYQPHGSQLFFSRTRFKSVAFVRGPANKLIPHRVQSREPFGRIVRPTRIQSQQTAVIGKTARCGRFERS
jgi:hypothetical protein